jgi:hypothetical protein
MYCLRKSDFGLLRWNNYICQPDLVVDLRNYSEGQRLEIIQHTKGFAISFLI